MGAAVVGAVVDAVMEAVVGADADVAVVHSCGLPQVPHLPLPRGSCRLIVASPVAGAGAGEVGGVVVNLDVGVARTCENNGRSNRSLVAAVQRAIDLSWYEQASSCRYGPEHIRVELS